MTQTLDILAQHSFGPSQSFAALTVVPLLAHEPRPKPYLVLDEALDAGSFRITEISEAGSVPILRAVNLGTVPVFLLDGEELVGARQNRVLNLSLLVPPEAETEIPVSCVEAGRWHASSAEFRAAERAQFASGRARRTEQVSRSLFRRGTAQSDQGDVWDAISEKAARMAAWSETGAMAGIFERHRHALKDYVEALTPAPTQAGAVYLIGGRVAGLDLFDSPETAARLASKLTASYAIDAMEEKDPAAYPDPPSAAEAFVRALTSAAIEPHPTTGLGRSLRLSTPTQTGAALEIEGRIVHLAAFPRAAGAGDRFRTTRPGMARASLRARH